MKRDPEGAGGESGVGRSQQLISKVPVALMRLKVVDNAEEDADAALRPPPMCILIRNQLRATVGGRQVNDIKNACGTISRCLQNILNSHFNRADRHLQTACESAG